MMLNNTTAVPNVLFDKHLAELSSSEIKVLLYIIRQTLGWRDKTGKCKSRDWISQSQFEAKTSLSRKTISVSLDLLIAEGIVEATDFQGNVLNLPQDRKGKTRIYYSTKLQPVTNSHNTQVKFTQNTGKLTCNKRNPTKEILSKEHFPITKENYLPTERIPDSARIAQILQEQEQIQTQRNRWH